MRLTTLALGLILTLASFGQQRPVTSTYVFNGMALNPAYAGILNVFSATFTNRDQWINIEGAPIIQSAMIHNSFNSNRVGAGLIMTRDKVGVHEDMGLYGAYSYKIRTSAGVLSMGLQAGFNNRQSNYTESNAFDPTDDTYVNLSRFSPNFGAGVYFSNTRLFAGISVPYMLTNKIFDIETDVPTNAKESRYYYANGGVIFELGPSVKISPSFLLRMQERIPFGWDLNTLVIFDDIAYAGVSYRSGDALMFMSQFILNENFRVGYAYDAITSPLTQYSKGTHEIMVNYRIKIKNAKKNPECPSYF